MKVYIAGPMRGYDRLNYPAFDQAAKRWREAGHTAFSPADMDRGLGYKMTDEPNDQIMRHVMMGDIICIYNSDAVALLPGWEKSSGATLELALAQFLGLEIYDAVTMEQIHPVTKPWSK